MHRSGYYRYLQGKRRQESVMEEMLMVEVRMLAKESQNSYGSRRMAKNLQVRGYGVGRYAARTLMRKAGIECKQRRRYRVTTHSKHRFTVATNVLNRAFTQMAPNRAWVVDMSYLWTLEGWLYIAAVLDLFSRRVVGWAMADHMRESLVKNALQMALKRRQPAPGLLHHSGVCSMPVTIINPC